MPEKTVAILNLSKTNRRYDVNGGLDKDGKVIILQILPNQKAVEVPETEAKFLLSTLPTGRARFPDLIDASKFRPADNKEKDAALAENARLLKENEELKAKMAGSTVKGGNKK